MSDYRSSLMYVVTEDWYFCSHRLCLAKAAIAEGYDVSVVTQVKSHGKTIESAGIKLIPLTFRRSGCNPFSDIKTIWSLFKIYRKEQPALLHHVSLKPVLYGTIAAQLAHVPTVINAMTGLGYVFTSKDIFASAIKLIIQPVLKCILGFKNTCSIFQNADDKMLLEGAIKEINKKSIIIRGSGVESNIFVPVENYIYPPKVVLASRILRDKGVHEFLKAARILKEEHVDAKFILVGRIDTENHSAIEEKIIQDCQQEGIIEWWGHRNNIFEILQKSTIACLPSYREGMPKFLLEAASCGLPIVTTDVPGCKEIVLHNKNGFLVPEKNPIALAEAIKILINDEKLRARFGREGRKMVEKNFSSKIINKQTIDFYNTLLT
ncbi:MAG: glycosyltransferase family 4 protein [Proteobacteria bacterium]|nr:glycosyltransferase family 4 protein [Pseudomonadota bacterium]